MRKSTCIFLRVSNDCHGEVQKIEVNILLKFFNEFLCKHFSGFFVVITFRQAAISYIQSHAQCKVYIIAFDWNDFFFVSQLTSSIEHSASFKHEEKKTN